MVRRKSRASTSRSIFWCLFIRVMCGMKRGSKTSLKSATQHTHFNQQPTSHTNHHIIQSNKYYKPNLIVFESKPNAVSTFFCLFCDVMLWYSFIRVHVRYCRCLNTVATSQLALRWMCDANGTCVKNNTYIYVVQTSNKSDHGMWSLLLLATTVWSIAH